MLRAVVILLSLAAIRSVRALGYAVIDNRCNFPVYMWAVDAVRNPLESVQIPSKTSYTEVYHNLSTGGVSLKLSAIDANDVITQLEYTLDLSASKIWYDGSNVNCATSTCPFYTYGMELSTSDMSCPTRSCPPDQLCTGFYTHWNDDVNSLSCDQDANIILTLCSAIQEHTSIASEPLLSTKSAHEATMTKSNMAITSLFSLSGETLYSFTTVYTTP